MVTGTASRTWWRVTLGTTLVAVLASPVAAQATADTSSRRDSVRVAAPPRQERPDSLKPPVSPGRAFLNSLLIPGLGQSRLDRPIPGAIFAGVEAVSIMMLLKTQNDLRIAERQAATAIVNRYRIDPTTGAPILDANGHFVPADTVPNRFDTERVESRQTQVEDWIAVMVFNHLLSGADAFVASLLWDFPARVGLRHLARGVGVGLSVRW